MLNNATAPRSLIWVVALCLGLVLILGLASLIIGAGTEVGIKLSIQVLLGQVENDNAHFTIYQLRLIRTLLALVVGSSLGAAGALLQTVTRNPLAEPGLLGVSQGAAFAVVLAIYCGYSAVSVSMGVAVLGALVGCMLVLLVSGMRNVGSDPIRLILAGAAFSGILLSASSLLLMSDSRSADEMRFWLIGALGGRSIDVLQGSLIGLVLGLCLSFPLLRPLAALALGERVAAGLGHKPHLTRFLSLLVVALLVGIATAAAGPIAFVGLVVPYLARFLVGPDIRRAFLISLLLGPSVLLFSDIVARVLVKPYELPIGVITAFVGAPILIAVVRTRRLPSL